MSCTSACRSNHLFHLIGVFMFACDRLLLQWKHSHLMPVNCQWISDYFCVIMCARGKRCQVIRHFLWCIFHHYHTVLPHSSSAFISQVHQHILIGVGLFYVVQFEWFGAAKFVDHDLVLLNCWKKNMVGSHIQFLDIFCITLAQNNWLQLMLEILFIFWIYM